MAQAYARKILTATWVLPEKLYTEELEEGGATQTFGRVDPVVGKHLAGRSRGGQVEIQADQLSDAWTSMTTRSGLQWEDVFETENWEDSSFYLGPWRAFVDDSFGSNAYPLKIRDIDTDDLVVFIYVENLGDKEVLLTINGTDYFIRLAAGTNFYTRLDNTPSRFIMVKQATEDGLGTDSSEVRFLAAI